MSLSAPRVQAQTAPANATKARLSLMDARVVPGATTTQYIQKITQLSNAGSVTGTLYGDFNQNSLLDNGESGYSTSGFFVKLVPSTGGNAIAAAAVNPTAGTYALPGVAAGNYNLVLDDNATLTDTTPGFPLNTAGSEAPNGVRSIVVGTTNVSGQNFGRYIGTQTVAGTLVSGRVFRDDGAGGGLSNNGILDGGETGIVGAQVRLQSSDGATTYDTRTTSPDGSYVLNWPAGITSAVRVVETNPASFRSTGAGVGSSNGTYSIATDAITYTLTYRNNGNEPLGNIALSDTTPTYTVFRSATTGALPTGITAPTTSFPAVGASGPLKWTFGGTLAPGASGTVTFVVRLQ